MPMDMPFGRALGAAALPSTARPNSLSDVEARCDADATRFGKHHGFMVTSARR